VPPEIAIFGAGTMGAGIAQLALEHDHRVRLIDVDPAAGERARSRISNGLGRRLVKRGLAGPALDDARAAILERLSLGLDPAEAAGAAVAIEAVVEQLEVKQALIGRLDQLLEPAAILATNTSALSIASIATAAREHPERVLGLHFFNPAPVMALVEGVAGRQTTRPVVEAAAALVSDWGRTPIRCSDHPGFIVNRVNRPFTIQALRELEEGESTIVEIDAALRAEGFPLGPFQLMDLIGIDVNLAAATGVWEGFNRAPRFRPSAIQAALVAAGRLGQKTGEGFYRYDASGALLGPATEFDRASEAGHDRPDEVVQRIRQAIADEAVLALDEGVAADEATVDLAMQLGAGHPEGPFAWARAHARRREP
jgi:3-hydroxybutyryl-CoA dehydrogenase